MDAFILFAQLLLATVAGWAFVALLMVALPGRYWRAWVPPGRGQERKWLTRRWGR